MVAAMPLPLLEMAAPLKFYGGFDQTTLQILRGKDADISEEVKEVQDGNQNLPSHFRDHDVGKRDFGRRDEAEVILFRAWFQGQGQHFLQVIRVCLIEITDLNPTDDFYYKTFFDAGEFGFRLSTVSLVPNRDCPSNAQFLDVYVHAADGTPFLIANAVCVFEQYGSILWRHTENGIPNESISLSGILEINGVDIKHKKEIKSDQHGTLVLENSIGVYHDHFYIYHLDLDIDGVNNSFEKTSLKTVRVTDGSSKRKSYWTTETETAESENDAKITIGSTPGELSVVNPNKKTSVGNDVV
ncbi:Primary amine oxidase [Vigna angularis]|uniref:Amine oxidase n=1 Tax=Phaseolus angularis TaxID=3914 RepID=A0A8T0L5J1_PHAAN|nr:Primary amine oxidase [Vigna angularis]